MSKKKKTSKAKTAEVENSAERGMKAEPIWVRRWFPTALFLFLSLLYFHEFVFSDKVVYGYDAGLDFRLGEDMTFGERFKRWPSRCGICKWAAYHSRKRFVPSIFRRIRSIFHFFSSLLGLALYPDHVLCGLGDVCISAANRRHALGRALGWDSLYVGSYANGLHLRWPICQNGRYRPLSVDVVFPK